MRAVIARLVRDVSLMIGLGRVADVDDSGGIQLLTLDMGNGETRTAKRYQDYGLSTSPPNDTRVVTGALGGRRSFLVGLKTDHPEFRHRDLKRGETILYTMFGDMIHLREGRIIYIKAATEVQVDAPLAKFSNDVEVGGNLLVKGVTTLESDLTQTAGSIETAGDIHAEGDVGAEGDLTAIGDISTTGGDVTAGDISLLGHRHGYRADGTDKISDIPQ